MTRVLAWTVFFSGIPAAMLILPDIATAVAVVVAVKAAGIALLFLAPPGRRWREDEPV
jgi:hypothetical protein